MSTITQWSKEVRIIAFIFASLFMLALVWFFRGAISPLVISALIAYVLSPIAEFIFKRTRLNRQLAVIIVYLAAILVLLAIPASITPVVINQVQGMNIDIAELIRNYDDMVDSPIYILQWVIYPNQFLPVIPETPSTYINPIAEYTIHYVEVVSKNVLWVFVSLITIYYLMVDGYKLPGWILRVAPKEYRADVDQLLKQLRQVWADYLRSQLAFMFVVGLVDSIVWLAIGLPGAIFLGLITGLTSFVHEIGAIVSGILSVGVALLLGSHFLPISNFWFAVVVLILYLILTAIKNLWIRPVIVGRHVHLHSGVVFVIIIAALLFFGALAAFVAVPVFVSLLVIGRYLRRRILGLPPFAEGEDPYSYFLLEPIEPEPLLGNETTSQSENK
ncbi:AI-2E family transporter [Chloroflexota bacterium]